MVTPIHIEADKKLTDLTQKVAQISEKGYDFLLGRIYLVGDNGNQNFLVFVPMLSSLTLNNERKVLIGYRSEYYLKKLNHLMLVLNRQFLT